MTGLCGPISSVYMIYISPSKSTDIIADLHPDAQFSGSAYKCTYKSDIVHFLLGAAFYPTKQT